MGRSSEEFMRYREELEAQRDQHQIELAERLERLYEEKKAEYEHYYSEKAIERRKEIESKLWNVMKEFHPIHFMSNE